MYMAPEILKSQPYDEKIDIWSAGVIFFNMITGCEPFSHGNLKNMEYNILNKPINFELIKNNDLRNLCQEMLERDPEKRIDSRNALKKAKIIKRKIFNEY